MGASTSQPYGPPRTVTGTTLPYLAALHGGEWTASRPGRFAAGE
jgi:hypothetical protein